MLEHGGHRQAAAERYAIPVSDWLDLSTGINPCGWQVPEIPAACWARLPEDQDGLVPAARAYYETEHLLPVPGSQAAIQAIPQLFARTRVAVLAPGYAEHAQAWRRAGHEVYHTPTENLDDVSTRVDVLVLIHPNNPTGAVFTVDQLLAWHARLASRGGWLMVDEAFIDVTPEHSLCRLGPREGLIILRSLGKFFGLAGARLGFVCAPSTLLARLRERLGPWPISTPARWVATEALQDGAWQATTRQRLTGAGKRLEVLLNRCGLHPAGGCALFQWVPRADAPELHEYLARQGILTRLFLAPDRRPGVANASSVPGPTSGPALRLGLPGREADWTRLTTALCGLTAACIPEITK